MGHKAKRKMNVLLRSECMRPLTEEYNEQREGLRSTAQGNHFDVTRSGGTGKGINEGY